ncbi:MAG: TonB-dependent receptor [Thiohalophilus sp.]|uniref:TonB-dependent receptor family protein n=1 Tax=Thiohalophilus sp. TaxID=3028392 RepID=UPI0028704428|nr:TonB-dependent receptor [Thiohalophilus sp.]MDR9437014.1 TonB-dependent receptor [Thiohalophilus sp.]
MHSKRSFYNRNTSRGFTPLAAAVAVAMASMQSVYAVDSSTASTRILERVTVVGSQQGAQEIAGSAHFISEEELEKHEYSDINRILREVPGVNLQEEEGYGLRPNIGMRGTGVDRSARITLMEDGILAAPAPYAAPAAYYFPSAGRMESVEVRKGSSSIKYGPNTTGGALNLISRSIPNEFGGQVDVSQGSDTTRRTHVHMGDSGEQFGWMAETFQYSSDGFKNLDNGGDTGFDTQDYLTRFRINTDAEADTYQELELKLGAYDEISNETYLGLTQDDFNTTPYRRYAASQRDQMNADQQQYSLRHFAELSPTMDVTTTLYRQDFARNWYKLDKVNGNSISGILDDPNTFSAEMAVIKGGDSVDDYLAVKANNREYYSQGIQSVLGTSFDQGGARHDIEYGLRYHEDEVDRFQHVDQYKMDNGTLVLTTAGAPGSESNRVSSARALAAFVQDTITFDKWTLQPGLRYESIDTERKDYGTSDPNRTGSNLTVTEHSVDIWIPGLGATYQYNDRVSLLAGVHRGFTPPSPGSDADPEKSVNFEAGLRYNDGAMRGEAIAFYNDYSNLLGTCTASSGGGCTIGDQFQAGEVTVQGLEASLSWDLAADSDKSYALPLRFGYTYTDATFDNGFSSSFGEWGTVEPGDEMPYLPQHQLTAGIGVEHTSWRVDLAAKYMGEMRTVAGQGGVPADEKVDSHVVFDLGGDYRFAENSKVYLTVENLLDETYAVARRPAGVRPGKPRTFMLGLKHDF